MNFFGEEFISNHQVLRELLGVMLTENDWENIASVAADSLKQQIMNQILVERRQQQFQYQLK